MNPSFLFTYGGCKFDVETVDSPEDQITINFSVGSASGKGFIKLGVEETNELIDWLSKQVDSIVDGKKQKE